MRTRRALLLLEVLVGLALLVALGVLLLRVQAGATRQRAQAEERRRATARLEQLLLDWRSTDAEVTLPSVGSWPDGMRWLRTTEPSVVRGALTATLVRVIVVRADPAATRLALAEWLVPPRAAEVRK